MLCFVYFTFKYVKTKLSYLEKFTVYDFNSSIVNKLTFYLSTLILIRLKNFPLMYFHVSYSLRKGNYANTNYQKTQSHHIFSTIIT